MGDGGMTSLQPAKGRPQAHAGIRLGMRPRATGGGIVACRIWRDKMFVRGLLVGGGRSRFARCPIYTVVMLDAAGRKKSDSPPGCHAQSELVPEHDSIGHMR